MTIGNIPKEVHRKHSSCVYMLLGYLPTTHLEHITNKSQKQRVITNLYHAWISQIFEPLELAGVDGIWMSTGSGNLYRVHLILAAFIGDYPEQLLITLGLNGDCPWCKKDCNDLGEYDNDTKINTSVWDLDEILDALHTFDMDASQFLQACASIWIKPIPCPFWLKLPFLYIYHSITPDVLHQMYQGIMKHVIQCIITIQKSILTAIVCLQIIILGSSLRESACYLTSLARSMTRCVNFFWVWSLMLLFQIDYQMHVFSVVSRKSWTFYITHSTQSILIQHWN